MSERGQTTSSNMWTTTEIKDVDMKADGQAANAAVAKYMFVR